MLQKQQSTVLESDDTWRHREKAEIHTQRTISKRCNGASYGRMLAQKRLGQTLTDISDAGNVRSLGGIKSSHLSLLNPIK